MISNEVEARHWLAQLPAVDKSALGRLEKLAALLSEENDRQNLVSKESLGRLWQRHICDSAQLLQFVSRETPWLDLGTGAGFPGLVIAALRPSCDVVLIESRTKRVDWLLRCAEALALDHVQVMGRRLEMAQAFEASVISARAFAPLTKTIELAQRFSTPQTMWLLPKGRSAAQELQDLGGWSHMFHVEQSITDPEAGIIVGTLTGRVG